MGFVVGTEHLGMPGNIPLHHPHWFGGKPVVEIEYRQKCLPSL
jgi:hypothetical protein